MNFQMEEYLPLVSVEIQYEGQTKVFKNVLLDTGCSSTILDTDLCEDIGLMLDLENAVTRKMYGIGGTEICIEQKVKGMTIGKFSLMDFTIQLGDVREMHGFDGILGSDFFLAYQMVIDYENMKVRKN
ncbi:retropepsin-like aspartic protease [Bacillus sp. RO1]|uniref:retropepsin-like aspartic protease n=1 Tax=Bacillus sp. RO1 TaxID=2722703 RepID=UPI001456538C|nr:retropepsin-like aspartic protease [Bacillus sp. RO1]NLP50202.1 hypothetical protein [Bacillus sp. RO1]